MDFSFQQAKKGTSPARMPMMTAPLEVTKPHAGVMTTRPATAPEQNPSTLGFPRKTYSSIAQVKDATAAASVVVVKALAAIPSAPSALPALNPYQPTHNIPDPTMHSTMLCGAMISFRKPSRGPSSAQSTNADHPDDIWTT